MDSQSLNTFFTERDRFAAHNGIKLVSVEKGRATAQMRIGDTHRNGADIVHGGALFTLADFVFAVAANSQGRVALSISGTIHYINPALDGMLTARAEESAHNHKLSVCRVTITDESGTLIAEFQGQAYRKREPLSLDPN
jgi:acyl-CoA thioesterase